ncbi:MAG: lytic murein transglycosylase [Bauldia sp.]
MTVRQTLFAAAMAAFGLAAAPALAQNCSNNPANFPGWLDGVRAEARAAGISESAIAALNGIGYDQSVVNRDRAQGVFSQPFLEFSDRMVAQYRLDRGNQLLRQYADLFARVERDFGVPGPVIVAFWALETDFGAGTGDFPTINAIATLAFDCRRPEEFRPQLLDALRLIDRGDLTAAQMVGAWAGELGQTQFRPTEYLRQGVDYDGDGRVDLFNSIPDVIASSANLAVFHGWQRGQPWLEEVRVPANLPWEQADVTIRLPRSQWAAWGVVRRDGSALPSDNLPASLVLPMGRNGPAFIAYPNFGAYLLWNESLVYSTTAAYLATRYAGAPRVSPGNGSVASLSREQIQQLQQILQARGYNVGGADGIIGAQTRTAVRSEQLRLGLPADGYPTQQFLAALGGAATAVAPAQQLNTDQARELQTILARLGYDIGAIDGIIGQRTRAAVADVQRQLGLPQDGIATPELLQRLRTL